jgi:hypothetical protein
MTQESARWDAGRRSSLRIAMRDHQYTPRGDLHDPTHMNRSTNLHPADAHAPKQAHTWHQGCAGRADAGAVALPRSTSAGRAPTRYRPHCAAWTSGETGIALAGMHDACSCDVCSRGDRGVFRVDHTPLRSSANGSRSAGPSPQHCAVTRCESVDQALADGPGFERPHMRGRRYATHRPIWRVHRRQLRRVHRFVGRNPRELEAGLHAALPARLPARARWRHSLTKRHRTTSRHGR